jgi:predicted dehydrogenase
MRTWNVGIVGLSRGQGFLSLFDAHPRMRVTALCDVNPATLSDLGAAFALPDAALYTDYEQIGRAHV